MQNSAASFQLYFLCIIEMNLTLSLQVRIIIVYLLKETGRLSHDQITISIYGFGSAAVMGKVI